MEDGIVARLQMVVVDGGWVEFRFCFGHNSDLIWVLVVFDLALSLSLSRQILVKDWLRFVFVDLVWVDPNLCF